MKLLADENFNGTIVRGLFRRLPNLVLVRVQDVGLMNADDPMILEWAATQERILLTHDVATITSPLSTQYLDLLLISHLKYQAFLTQVSQATLIVILLGRDLGSPQGKILYKPYDVILSLCSGLMCLGELSPLYALPISKEL